VNFTPPAVDDYASTVVIERNGADEPNVGIHLSGTGLPEPLQITPANDVSFFGHPGGPFVRTYECYTLENICGYSVEWYVTGPNWLDISPDSGTIDPCELITVCVWPNAQADMLPEGTYCAELVFVDVNTTKEQERKVCLNVYTDPKIWIRPSSVEVTLRQGETQSQALTIGNSGGADLIFSVDAAVSGTPSIQLDPNSGTIGPGDANVVNVIFSVDCNSGVYSGQITLNSNDPYEPTINIPVTITVEVIDFFVELFDSGNNDMSNRTLTFIPNGLGSYNACATDTTDFPVDPASGTALSLADDDYYEVNLDGAHVRVHGKSYQTLYIGSNGYITFTSGDISYYETLTTHFAFPRISGLFDDLDPSAGGTISWKQLGNRVVVTFEDVPEFSLSNSNSFQIEMYFDGRIRITWLDITAQDGLIGFSDGKGAPPCLDQSDFSEYDSCIVVGDLNGDWVVNAADVGIFVGYWLDQHYHNGGAETVRDEFAEISYNNNDGTQNWNSPWLESGEPDGPRTGLLQIVSGQLRIGAQNKRTTPVRRLSREADLTGAASATLTYDYEAHNNADAGLVSLQISGDGGANWDTLANYYYYAGDGSESFDITPYISSNTWIRFQTSSQIRMYLYVDNIQIEYHIPPPPWYPWSDGCDFNHDFQINFEDYAIMADGRLE
jgi:hypothetical protein